MKIKTLIGVALAASLIIGCASKEKKLPKELNGVKIKKTQFYGDSIYYEEPKWFKDSSKKGFIRKIGYSIPAEEENTLFLQTNLAIQNANIKLKKEIMYKFEKVKLEEIEFNYLELAVKKAISQNAYPAYKWMDRNQKLYVLIEINESVLKIDLEENLKVGIFKKIEEVVN